MPLDNPRIEELRRRVQADPASIAFAQLAEEYRRAGNYDEAVRACRLGLARHPGYLSARVTLGRALLELESLDEAQQELEFVLRAAPENLAAIRGMAEIHHRRGHMAEALEYYQRALGFARHDPTLEETVEQIARELGGGPPDVAEGLSFEEAQAQLISAIEGAPAGPVAPVSPPPIPQAAPPESAAVPPIPAAAAPDALPIETPEPATSVYSAAPVEIASNHPPAAPSPEPQEGGEDPFDFEALLGALGEAPDRAAPSPIEALLASPPSGDAETPAEALAPAAEALAPTADVPPAEIPAPDDDPLAALEASLRTHVPTPMQTPAPAPEAELSPLQQAIVDDLEAWLDELVVERGGPTDRS
ncbi:MAG: tetratricopeptide repeat protein [Vicinamibacterales bacterium]|nr:tetratricopeptide repeat protein [Vicinamibacterales bacterium]